VHVELVGVDRALHHGFAQPVGCGDEHHVAETGFGIEREQHAGTGDIRTHHALYPGRQRHVGMGKTVMHPIGNGAVVVERGEDLFYIQQQRILALHMQIGFLLPGKRGIGQILRSGRRAHRNRHPLAESAIRLAQPRFQRRRQGGRFHPGTNFRAGPGQGRHISHIQRRQPVINARA